MLVTAIAPQTSTIRVSCIYPDLVMRREVDKLKADKQFVHYR